MATATRIKVEIERSTKKAHLITDGSRKGWIQKRWMDDEGSVSARTFDNACAKYEERSAQFKAAAAAERDFRNAYRAVEIARETEKAVAIEIEICAGDQYKDKLVWFPKSQVRGENEIPGWLLMAKHREVEQSLQHGVFIMPKSEDVFLP